MVGSSITRVVSSCLVHYSFSGAERRQRVVQSNSSASLTLLDPFSIPASDSTHTIHRYQPLTMGLRNGKELDQGRQRLEDDTADTHNLFVHPPFLTATFACCTSRAAPACSKSPSTQKAFQRFSQALHALVLTGIGHGQGHCPLQ